MKKLTKAQRAMLECIYRGDPEHIGAHRTFLALRKKGLVHLVDADGDWEVTDAGRAALGRQS